MKLQHIVVNESKGLTTLADVTGRAIFRMKKETSLAFLYTAGI